MEVAGIVLGAIPLIIKGLSSLYSGACKIKHFRNSQRILRRLVWELEMEQGKFENTCEIFLEGVVPPEDLEALVSGKGWENQAFQTKLRQKFR
jgi:hypothetical protein